MRLTGADIRNFRSIKDVHINFEPRCRVLVGINESGKSNILQALALLDEKRQPTPGDLRDFLPEEDLTESAYVRFLFTLDERERITAYEEAVNKILSPNLSEPVVAKGKKSLTLAQFFDTRTEVIYSIDIRTGMRGFKIWRLPDTFLGIDHWCKPSPKCPANYQHTLPDGRTIQLKSHSLIHRDLVSDVQETLLMPATPEDVNVFALEQIAEIVKGKLPGCLYWTYSDSHLLPGQISLDQFASNPTMCEPLRHMFALADIEDISTAVAEARSRPNGIRNLLNRVARKATKHMKSVWKEYRGITIELAPNGANVDAHVKDEYNLYDFDRRSDGFKRFISFLLMVSAGVRTAELVNTLYLHDEPDTSLHPSGARYLRDELIKISATNYVVYSTHSIFMVDRELLRRHLIVEKTSEVTEVREVDESNITDEEVIYNALGYSVFETLKKNNIIFEGWRDKRLCLTALKAIPKKHKSLKSAFAEIGMCHARGVKDIGRITPLLELADRHWVVVSDGDRPAIEHQKQYDGAGPWLRYDELLPNSGIVTGEDFIKIEAFKTHIDQLRSENPALPEFDVSALAHESGKLHVMRKWLQSAGLTPEQQKESLETLKERLFQALKPSHLEDRYYDFLIALEKRLTSLTARSTAAV